MKTVSPTFLLDFLIVAGADRGGGIGAETGVKNLVSFL